MCDNVGNCTTVGPFTFEVDLTAPVITTSVNSPKSAGGYDGPGTVIDASAADGGSGLSSFTYAVTPSGGPAGPAMAVPPSGQIPVTQAGTFTYSFTATSTAGQTTTASVTASVDVTPPSVSCSQAPTGWQTANVTITCNASDPLVGLPAGATPFTLKTSVAAGTSNAAAQTNAVTVCDNVGNCTTVGPLTFEVDLTTPVITASVNAPKSAGGYDGPGTVIDASASDSGGSGLSSFTYTVTPSGGSAGPAMAVPPSGQIPVTQAGTFTYSFTATSTAGQTTTASVTASVDVTPPSVSCSQAPTGWQTANVTITCNASDPLVGLPAGATPFTLKTSVAAGTSNAAAQTNAVTVCDNVGNCTTVGPLTFEVDLTTPVITASVNAPKSAGGYDGPGTVIDASASDSGGSGLSSFTYTVTPSATAVAGSAVTVPSSGQIPVTQAGTFTYTFTATSVAGATKTASVKVSVDLTPPSVSCSQAPTGWQTANVTITCTASDALVGLPSGANPITLKTSVAAGTSNAAAQTNAVTVCDNVGNCTTVGPLTFEVDLTTPVITTSVIAKSANGYDGPGTVIDASVSDGGSGLKSFTYTVTPSATAAAAASAVTVPPSGQIPVTQAGTFTYTFTATSVAGATKTASVKVSVDLTPPSVSCSQAPTGWQTANVTITCTASDALVGLPSGTNPITLSTSVAAGTSNASAQTNAVTVCDNVGNCTTAGPIKGIEVDLTAPSISITTPTNAQVLELNQPATASFTCADTGGSGIKTCTAKVGSTAVTSGGSVPTGAVGVDTLTVTATTVAGGTVSKSVTYDVTYNLCNVAAVTASPSSEVTFVLSVCTYQGTNVGSASIAVTAVNVDGTTTPKGVAGNNFTWIPATKTYSFLMLTTNLTKGSHTLNVSITGDPLGHSVAFKV